MESDVTQSAAFYKTWAWVEAHKKQLVLGSVVLLVVGLGVGFYVYHKNERENEASVALSRVLSQNLGQPAAPEAYESVASEYSGTAAAERASLLAGVRLFDLAKYPESVAQFQKFLSTYPNSQFSPQALLGIASSLEAQGKTAEALKAYQNVVDRGSSSPVAPQARLAMARLNESSGNLVQARDLYQQLMRADYGSIAQEASMALETLLSKNPSLNPSAQVAPAPVPAVQAK